MEKITNIQNYIIELYGLKNKNGEYNAEANRMFTEKSIKNWDSALKHYSEEQIKGAIDYYHKFKNNKTAPRINQLLGLLNLDKKEESVEFESELKKPNCPIAEWQEDFDLVLRQGCIKGVVFNPYWNKQPDIEQAHKDFIQHSPFEEHKALNKWQDALVEVKRNHFESYQKLLKYEDEVLLYTYAYKKGILEL